MAKQATVHPIHPATADVARASDGSTAELARDGEVEVLRVRDGRGRIVFEHRPAEGRSVVYAPEGDLAFSAAGDISLEAGGAVRIDASEVTASARAAVRVGTERAGLELRGGAAQLDAERLRVATTEARVETDRGELRARLLETTIEHARHAGELLELRVGRIIERARESYREVEELAQTRAGRLRLVAERTFHMLGERTLMKARQDVKVDGKKVYIG
jgi:hypothetical protein